ncbi:CATL2 protein, partial [Casuarius casuarius]|nr:CATL2 protein [Casuarius casuarius]
QPGAMAVPLGLLLATLGCAAALDPALEEAWRGWKSLHAKEYPENQVGAGGSGRAAETGGDNLRGGKNPAPSGRPRSRAGVGRWDGAVTPRRGPPAQGHCGSCWAFSATGALEGLVFNRTGKLVVLSEQNLIDCSRKLGNEGCGGGYITRAFQYVHDNGGLNSEHVYPYLGTDASSCRYDPRDRAANCSAVWLVAAGSEAALEQAVAAVGPVSVAVDASSFHFHFYKSGIFSSAFCSQQVNHAMLAVGYGTSQQNGQSVGYWILKNSWSEAWGERGYIRLLKGVDNHCGVANQASFPAL